MTGERFFFRKALLVAYPSTSATLSVGEVGRAMAPRADMTYGRARSALSRHERETRSSMYVNIPLEGTPARGEAAARLWY